MRIYKPLRLGLLTRTHPYDGGGAFIVTTFTLFDLMNPDDVLAETAMWPLVAQELPEGAIFDAGMPKPTGEVLVAGRAMAPGGQPVQAMRVAVELGEVRRLFTVFGDRRWQMSDAGPVFSVPDPFLEMPMLDRLAFGGEGYASNPSGRGAEAEALLNSGLEPPLPNIEVAGQEIRSVLDQPPVASVGALAPDQADRIALAGTYDQDWIDRKMPEFPDDFDPRYFLTAPVEQRLNDYFTGFEAIRLVGLSAQYPLIESRMPGVRVRAFVELNSRPGDLHELKMRTDTVWLLGSQAKGIVINRGVLKIADPNGLDVRTVMVGYELRRNPVKPLQHYQEVFRLRSDPEHGFKYSLSDDQLSPRVPLAMLQAREEKRQEQAKDKQWAQREARAWRERRVLESAGAPPSLATEEPDENLRPLIVPDKADIARGDVDLARLISDIELMKREAEAKSQRIVTLLQPLDQASGLELSASNPETSVEYDEALLGPGFLPSIADVVDNPHIQSALSELDRIDETLAGVDRSAVPMGSNATFGDLVRLSEQEAPEAEIEDEGLGTDLKAACARVLQTSQSRPLFEALQTLDQIETDERVGSVLAKSDVEEPANLRTPDNAGSTADKLVSVLHEDQLNALEEVLPGGATLADNQSLSPQTVSSIQTAISILDDVVAPGPISPAEGLSDVKRELLEADVALDQGLREARRLAPQPISPERPLSPSNALKLGQFVVQARASGHSLAGADMAGALLAGVDLSGHDLSGAFFEKCDLRGANLRNANCQNAVFTGAQLEGADLSNSNLQGANFSRAQARGTRFDGCKIIRATVLDADFADASFAGAKVDAVTWIRCALDRVSFENAGQNDVRFVECSARELSMTQVGGTNIIFLKSDLTRSTWRHARLVKGVFGECPFAHASFAEAVLETTIFLGETDLTEADFQNVIAAGCGFQTAKLVAASFVRAVLDGSNFMLSDLSDADLRLSSWRGANLGFAILRTSDLFGANLHTASLRGADLTQASLMSANLFRADLSEAQLAQADLSFANVTLNNMEARLVSADGGPQ